MSVAFGLSLLELVAVAIGGLLAIMAGAILRVATGQPSTGGGDGGAENAADAVADGGGDREPAGSAFDPDLLLGGGDEPEVEAATGDPKAAEAETPTPDEPAPEDAPDPMPPDPPQPEASGGGVLATLASVLKAIVMTALIVGLVIAFVGTLFFPPPYNTIALYVSAFGAGVLAIPAFIYLFGKSLGGMLMTPLARVMFTIGTITTGGVALDRRAYGQYEAQPLRRSPGAPDGEAAWDIRRDGEWVGIDDGLEYVTRLGTKPFALTYEKSDVAFKKWLADVQREDTRAITDGGEGDYYQLDVERAGSLSQFSPRAVVESTVEGFVIRMEAIRNSLRGAGGTGIADKSQEEAMKEYGGNTEMGTKVMIAYVITMAVLAVFAAGWVLG